MMYAAKTNALISCAFVFRICKSGVSHDMVHFMRLALCYRSIQRKKTEAMIGMRRYAD